MRRTNPTVQRVALCAALAITGGLCYLNTVTHGQPAEQVAATVVPVGWDATHGEAKIWEALDASTSVEFVEAPVSDVVSFLSDLHDIPIVLDTRALDGVGIGSDTPITIKLRNVRLSSALNLILRQVELRYVVRDEVLLITFVDETGCGPVTHVYDVPDLMRSPLGDEHAGNSLISLLTSIVAPQTWDEVGGPGTISTFGGSLVITNEEPVQRSVQAMLTQLRRARYTLQHHPAEAFARRWDMSDPAGEIAREAIRKALAGPVAELQLVDTSLAEAVDLLANKSEISILLDTRALEGIGIAPDVPVTLNTQGITLRSALDLMLRELELTVVERDDVLWITTWEESEAHLTPTMFLVRDLLESPALAQQEGDLLVELITTNIAPQTWDAVGGAGMAQFFPAIDAIVVEQTGEVLEQVEDLLGKLRHVRQARKPWSADSWAEQQKSYLETPQYQIFVLGRDQNGQAAVSLERAIGFFRQSLDRQWIAQADLREFEGSITMFLNPKQAAEVDRLLLRSQLPIYRRIDMGGGRYRLGPHGEGGFGGQSAGFQGGVF